MQGCIQCKCSCRIRNQLAIYMVQQNCLFTGSELDLVQSIDYGIINQTTEIAPELYEMKTMKNMRPMLSTFNAL